jgi:hypothetical protein
VEKRKIGREKRNVVKENIACISSIEKKAVSKGERA